MTKTVAEYLCSVMYPNEAKVNPCSEIALPVWLDKNSIILHQLQGAQVFNHTENLCLEPKFKEVEQ
jgi:hypothetical protein